MLRISKLTDYGALLLGHMAQIPEKKWNATELANLTHIARPTTSKLLKLLSSQQLLISSRGVKGGYRLGRDSRSISLVDIITAVEGNEIAVTACSSTENTCVLLKRCLLKKNWQTINYALVQALADITLFDLIKPVKVNFSIKGYLEDDRY